MNSYENIPEQIETSSTSLHRSDSMTNLSKLLPFHQRASRTPENRSSELGSRRSQSNNSENSQILYMSASKSPIRRRGVDRSLSSISNGTSRRLDGSTDHKPDELESAEDMMSRNTIDREIFEWQYVCQSGRPYWWTPQSQNTRTNRSQHKLAGMQRVGSVPKLQYNSRRQTVSDSYLVDPNTVHELAHLVAVQLLGACFTLPPDAITAVTPQYMRDEDGIAAVKDPRLISSLRMHTHFRYSPSFGHQARNTSPVELWLGRYDGQQSGSSPVHSSTESSIPNIGTSSPCSRRPRVHGMRNNTEGSGSRASRGEDNEDNEDCIGTRNKHATDPTTGAWASDTRQSVHSGRHRPSRMHRMSDTTNSSHPPRYHSNRSKEDESISRSLSGIAVPKSNYRLEPVLRSEPHHVFIQPVRELVVRRWRKLQRRFSGSLHSSLPAGTSDDLPSASESSASEESNAILSSDAKVRRLRAQERGDIHSSSMDSTPHYNTPKSGHLSPNGNELVPLHRFDSQSAIPVFPLGDPLAAAASLVAAEMPHMRSFPLSTPSKVGSAKLSDTLSSRGNIHSPATSAPATCSAVRTKSEITFFPPFSKPNTASSPVSFSSQRSTNRTRRRSMLSEVCTPEDFQIPKGSGAKIKEAPVERSALSEAGSTLPSPRGALSPGHLFVTRRTHDVMSSPGPSVMPALAELRAFGVQERPRMSRTSTSGTQIFTPNDDGVEIDGLPVGPSRHTWAAKGGRRERTYL